MGSSGGGGGRGGRSGGGGSTNGDAGQPGEVVRAANVANRNDQLKRAMEKTNAEYQRVTQGMNNLAKAQKAIEKSGPTGPGTKNYELNTQLTRALNKGLDRREILKRRYKNIKSRLT
jgi:hypothetical protein